MRKIFLVAIAIVFLGLLGNYLRKPVSAQSGAFKAHEGSARVRTAYSFRNISGTGFEPGGLIFDGAGNLYGSAAGGKDKVGLIFELSPKSGDSWSESVLYNFRKNTTDGRGPGSLVFDTAGNLYGSTYGGGNRCGIAECGTVFELSPSPEGKWSEKILYSFAGNSTGFMPGPVIFDSGGNLYGVTEMGGTDGCDDGGQVPCGLVFELLHRPDGTWTEKVLHEFTGGEDGAYPGSGLVFDAAGNLYGTTNYGGGSSACYVNGCGTVFELSPQSNGSWTESILHSFSLNDGSDPGTLIMDTSGRLYGTALSGGTNGGGTVYELSLNQQWIEKTIYNFPYISQHGYDPNALAFDDAGNLYGTTLIGGTATCEAGLGCGTIFELTHMPSGSWVEKMHSFQENGMDGDDPGSNLVFDKFGNLYGATRYGGTGAGFCKYLSPEGGCGTIFELTP